MQDTDERLKTIEESSVEIILYDDAYIFTMLWQVNLDTFNFRRMFLKPFILFSNITCADLIILIIGLGQLGLAAAKYVKERGFDAHGYDINT